MRIIVIGTSCSGKSTAGRLLAEHLNEPWTDLDELWWNPNWIETPIDQFRGRVSELSEGTSWVISGSHTNSRDLLWHKATHIVWLDYSFPFVFWRAVKRTVRRVWTKEEICNGNYETFGKAFMSRDSILWWVITTFAMRRKDYREWLSRRELQHVQVIRLRKRYRGIREVVERL